MEFDLPDNLFQFSEEDVSGPGILTSDGLHHNRTRARQILMTVCQNEPVRNVATCHFVRSLDSHRTPSLCPDIFLTRCI